jgi:hypothetical protein
LCIVIAQDNLNGTPVLVNDLRSLSVLETCGIGTQVAGQLAKNGLPVYDGK